MLKWMFDDENLHNQYIRRDVISYFKHFYVHVTVKQMQT